MGSFSWMRADKTTKRSNLTMGDKYKILIPQNLAVDSLKIHRLSAILGRKQIKDR